MKAKRISTAADLLRAAQESKSTPIRPVTRTQKMKLLQFMRKNKLTFAKEQCQDGKTSVPCVHCGRALTTWENVFLIDSCRDCLPDAASYRYFDPQSFDPNF